MKITDRRFLPKKTTSCHAATVAFFNNHPVFSWFGGSREGAGDVSIYINNLLNRDEVITIGNGDVIPRWNPILIPINNRLILFEKRGTFCDRWSTFVHDITDWTEGITDKEISSCATILPAGINGPVKSCPLFLGDKLVCGSSVETAYDWSSYIEYFLVKPDGKLTFDNRSSPITVPKIEYVDKFSQRCSKTMGIIQPTLWKSLNENGDLILHAFFRSSNGLNKIYYSQNNYYLNQKWTNPIPTNLVNPNSAVDVVCCGERVFLVHNPSEDLRRPLVLSEIRVDYDGESVDIQVVDQIVITDRVSGEIPCISQELSYPYMIEKDGKLHLVYTYGRGLIEYCVISIA